MGVFRDNPAQNRFEWEENGEIAFADYRIGRHGERAVTHVETPVPLRGGGVAKPVMDGAVADARAHGYKLVALCPYAVAYRKRYPETDDVFEDKA
ncbi:MAG: GNAT family N-acetyltransferase [Alphaproteobacteria bacterium]